MRHEITMPVAGPVKALLLDHGRALSIDRCACGVSVNSNLEHLRHLVTLAYEAGHFEGWMDVLHSYDRRDELSLTYRRPRT